MEDKSRDSERLPVMCGHPAVNGEPTQLVRGGAPSTPRRSEKRRMSIKKYFRVTPEESASIQANAADAGVEEASYIRAQTLGKSKMRSCRRIRADWDELRHCLGKVNQAGNIINQLAALLRKPTLSSEMAGYNSLKLQGQVIAALEELRASARSIVVALRQNR